MPLVFGNSPNVSPTLVEVYGPYDCFLCITILKSHVSELVGDIGFSWCWGIFTDKLLHSGDGGSSNHCVIPGFPTQLPEAAIVPSAHHTAGTFSVGSVSAFFRLPVVETLYMIICRKGVCKVGQEGCLSLSGKRPGTAGIIVKFCWIDSAVVEITCFYDMNFFRWKCVLQRCECALERRHIAVPERIIAQSDDVIIGETGLIDPVIKVVTTCRANCSFAMKDNLSTCSI